MRRGGFIEIMKYKQIEIGQRIKNLRLAKSLRQDDFISLITNKGNREEKDVSIAPNVLQKIENGEIFGKNKNYLSEKQLQILSDVLEISKREIIFGKEEKIKEFVMQFFYQAVTNIHPKLLG